MAALTNSQRLRESRRKREEEEKKSSSQSASGNYKNSEKLEKRRLERNIGLDTFESDLKSVGNSISNVYSGWQTQETMLNTRKSVEEMHKRLGDYQTYQSKFGGNDLSDVVSGYQSVLDEWDNLSSTYGTYQNADAFNNARKKAQFDKQFSVTNADGTVRGLTYDEVQSKLKEYEKGSDEHNYLSQYMGYSDLMDFDKAIKNTKNDSSFLKELETKRNQYALDNKFDLYKDYMNAEDFEEKSQYSSTKMDNAWKKLTSTYSMGYGDLTYEYINNVDGVRDEIERKASIYGQDTGDFSSSNEKKGYDKLNEDEVAVYNYLYQTEGKDKAQEFLDDMEIVLTKRVYDEATQRWEDAADSGAVASTIMSALSVPANIFGAAYTAGDTLRDAIQGKEYNPYGYYKTPSNFASDTRGYVSENIAEETEGMELFGQNIPSFLYQTGMSVADTAVGSQLFGNGFTAVMGVSAAQQKAKELKEAGASSEEVARGAVGSGLIEMVFEKISIDNLLKAKNPDSFLKILKETAKQSGIEGSEEFFTETANVIFDNLNRGDMSDTYQKYEEYLERGYTKEEAEKKVKQELNSQIGWAFVGGAVSGSALGSASTVAQYHDLSQTGSTIRENQTMDDLKNVASGMNNDSYQKYLDLIDSGKISDAKLGNFFTQVEADTMENVETERKSAVMREIANKVNEMGDSKNSGMIAAAITKKLNGENLSEQEKAVLKTDTAKTVISDIKNGKYDFKNIINTSDSVVDASMKHSKVMSTYTTSKTKEELAIKERAKELANVDEAKVGEEVDNIEGIRIEDGVATLLTSQGEVLADNAILSAQKAELVAYAETMGNEKGNLFYSQYDGNTDVETYRNAFNLAYSYGESQLGMATAQQNIKSLNTSQLSEIYRAGRMERVKVRQKEINAIKNKYAAKHFYKGNVNDSIIDYTNSGKGEVNWDDLSEGQKENVELAKALYTGLGVNVRFTTEGTKKKYNGYYNPAKNEVVIDLYAGTNIGNVKDRNLALVTTSAHELTHWMEKLSPEMFAKIKDHVFETLHKSDGITDADRIDAEIGRILSEHPDMKTVSDEYAISEIVARACEDMLSMTDVGKEALSRLTESERKTFFEKAKEIIQDMIAYIDEILGRYKSKSAEAIALREYQDELKQLAKMWETAMKEAVEVNQSIIEAAINGEKLVNGISKDGTTIVGENVLQMSEKTYNDGG